jgi:hypothetical protein
MIYVFKNGSRLDLTGLKSIDIIDLLQARLNENRLTVNERKLIDEHLIELKTKIK